MLTVSGGLPAPEMVLRFSTVGLSSPWSPSLVLTGNSPPSMFTALSLEEMPYGKLSSLGKLPVSSEPPCPHL